MTTNNDCKGCYSKSRNNICVRMHHYKNGICPCVTCLIKVMCMEACDEYRKFWRGMGEPNKERNKIIGEAYKGY